MEESGRGWIAIVWLTSMEPSWTDICKACDKSVDDLPMVKMPQVSREEGWARGRNGRMRED